MGYPLLAITTLGIVSLTTSCANSLDLKKENEKNHSCIKRFETDSDMHFCITSKKRVVHHYTFEYPPSIRDVGKLGKASYDRGNINQFEIEDGKLVLYKCKALNKPPSKLICADEVESITID